MPIRNIFADLYFYPDILFDFWTGQNLFGIFFRYDGSTPNILFYSGTWCEEILF